MCVTVQRLLQWAYTPASNVRKTALEGLGYISFCCLYRKCSQYFKEFSKPAHRPVQPTSQTRWFTQFCVNTASRYHLQMRIWKESARPCYPAWQGFLTVCHSAGGRSTRCCIVPLLGIDSNRTMAVIRQRDVKKRIVQHNSSHTDNPGYITRCYDNKWL